MSKIICPKCGHEFDPNSKAIIEATEAEVKKRVEEKEKELKRIYELENNAKVKELENKLESLTKDKDTAIKLANNEIENKYKDVIRNLEEKIKSNAKDAELNYNKTLGEYKEEIATLKGELSNANNKTLLQVNEALKKQQDKFDNEKKFLNEQISYYKDFKAKLTVKEIGESLEQYCENKFNEQRMISFKNAYFEKDSDLSVNHEKGDYIYRDYIDDEKKIELTSIMFDMKHEGDETSTKHKNIDFLKKLDSDRTAKKCEYAVLVSTLEADNPYYGGITDMSYKYPKMYVVRPQCFMAFISLVKNMALKNKNAQYELAEFKKQNLDVTNFENSMKDFKEDFMGNVSKSAAHFEKAIKGIDDTIAKLQKTKEELIGSMKQLNVANNKVQAISIRKLTKNSPSIAKLFKEE